MDLCSDCKMELPWIKQACHQCGVPFVNFSTPQCGKCLKKPPFYNHTLAIFNYQAPVAQLITELKFQHKLLNANLLAELANEKILQHYERLPECIIPVPLHHTRLKERGFNQALELAKPLAKALKIPLITNSCQRIFNTQTQSSIPAAERYHNIKNAFVINHPIKAKHIAIIDDVVTTGNTVNELSKQFKKSGTTRIDIWCLARTSLHKTPFSPNGEKVPKADEG